MTTAVRARRDDKYEARYVVAGSRGAIEYHALAGNTFALGVEYHDPRPQHPGQEPQSCHILEGACYPDGSSSLAHRVRLSWLLADRDDEVIWAELEERYANWESEG
jgi:hypothetical protein